MNVDILTHEKSISKARARMAIADCDIHPSPKSVEIEIFPFLSKRWQEYMGLSTDRVSQLDLHSRKGSQMQREETLIQPQEVNREATLRSCKASI